MLRRRVLNVALLNIRQLLGQSVTAKAPRIRTRNKDEGFTMIHRLTKKLIVVLNRAFTVTEISRRNKALESLTLKYLAKLGDSLHILARISNKYVSGHLGLVNAALDLLSLNRYLGRIFLKQNEISLLVSPLNKVVKLKQILGLQRLYKKAYNALYLGIVLLNVYSSYMLCQLLYVVGDRDLVKASRKIIGQILFKLCRAFAHLLAAYVFLVDRIVKISAEIANCLPLYLVKFLVQ